MKKTYNINLAGYSYVIDEDAYEMLHSYLTTLSQVCEKAGERETAADIEQRIAEIFSEDMKTHGPVILTIVHVEEVIRRIGRPEEIMDMNLAAGEGGAGSVPPVPPGAPQSASIPFHKRLYRDTEHSVIAGVCSGIAWYIGCDPVLVRVLAVILSFLSGSVLFMIYVILWIVIPPAKTPFERMQMMGVDPSLSNVGRVVTGEYNPNASRGMSPKSEGKSFFSNVGKLLMVFFAAVALLCVGSLLLSCIVGLVGCLIALLVLPIGVYYSGWADARLVLGCVCGALVVAGIPLFLLFRNLLGVLTGRPLSKLNREQRVALLIFWLIAVGVCIVTGCLM